MEDTTFAVINADGTFEVNDKANISPYLILNTLQMLSRDLTQILTSIQVTPQANDSNTLTDD